MPTAAMMAMMPKLESLICEQTWARPTLWSQSVTAATGKLPTSMKNAPTMIIGIAYMMPSLRARMALVLMNRMICGMTFSFKKLPMRVLPFYYLPASLRANLRTLAPLHMP